MYMAKAYFLPPRAKSFEPRTWAIHVEGLSAAAIKAALVTAMNWRPTTEPKEVVKLRPCHIQIVRIADSGRSDLRKMLDRAVSSRRSNARRAPRHISPARAGRIRPNSAGVSDGSVIISRAPKDRIIPARQRYRILRTLSHFHRRSGQRR